MKKRIEFIDLAKGICILLVVQIHVYGDTSYTFFNAMTIFRMPLYFFLSGIFFKTYDCFFIFIRKKINRLIIPFVFFYIFSIMPLHITFDYILPQKTINLQDLFLSDYGRLFHRYNGAVWFLVSLFITNIYFYSIHYICSKKNTQIALLSIICGLGGYYMNYKDFYLPLWMDTSLTSLPFFAFGYILKSQTEFLSSSFTKSHYVYLLASLIVVSVITILSYNSNTLIIEYDPNIYKINFHFLYIGGLAGIMTILILSKRLKHVYLISYLGRYSIVVLCTHLIYILILRSLLFKFGIPQENGIVNTSIYIFIIIISIPTIKYGIMYMPRIFAQKDLW